MQFMRTQPSKLTKILTIPQVCQEKMIFASLSLSLKQNREGVCPLLAWALPWMMQMTTQAGSQRVGRPLDSIVLAVHWMLSALALVVD